MRCAVFDCDGTLVDGQAAVCDSMEAAFAEAGLPAPDRNAVRRIVGLSLPQAVMHLAPETQKDARAAVVEAYKAHFRATRESGALREVLYDGIRETLHTLHDADWMLAVATGKSHPAMLEAALVECGAAPADAVMIGDTSFDIEMAKAAGATPIGVAWGYHEPDELLRAGAVAVAQSPAQLTEILLER